MGAVAQEVNFIGSFASSPLVVTAILSLLKVMLLTVSVVALGTDKVTVPLLVS